MKKITFKNCNKWEKCYLVPFDAENVCGSPVASRENGKTDELEFDFDDAEYIGFYIASDDGNKTGKVYSGNLSLGVEYKYNSKMGRDLTYLYSSDLIKSGRVENFVLYDDFNLSYREDRSKKISVFIPNSYDGITPHDILYFFDSQNLFCKAGVYTENGDPYGSWQLDLVISELHRQHGKNIIVVGIDNSDMYRSRELFMNSAFFGKLSSFATDIPDDDFSKGYLEKLSSFMVTTLHSFIKEKYCISDKNIGIGGSSMGGIASFFCGLYETGFYKYVLAYSPAFALYEMDAFKNWFSKLSFRRNIDLLPKIHIYCGGGDELERQLLPVSQEMKGEMIEQGYPLCKVWETYDIDKPHNEESWRLILAESFSLLLDAF